MKVVHIETGLHLYGGPLQVVFLLRGLKNLPGQHVLICSRGSAIAEAARESADKVYAVSMRGDLDIGFINRVRTILRQEQPDLVHIHSRRGADSWGAWAARLEKIPTILSRRVDNPEPRWLVKWKYRLYSRVITISEGIRQVLLSEGVPQDKVICVRSAVDTERYRPNGDLDWFRREFSLQADELSVGMIAQLIERKGHRVLLAAIPAILKRHPRTRFLLFGKGPLQKSLKQLCNEQQLEDRVCFAGFRDDLDNILPCLNLVVHPALLEGLGVALLQAAACAVPIVASRVGGIPEIVRDKVNGALVEPGNALDLAGAITDLLANPSLAARYGERGRHIVLEDFSIPAMAAGNYQVYREVLEQSVSGS